MRKTIVKNNKNEKKIIIITPKGFIPELTGGLEISALEIAKIFTKNNFQVSILCKKIGSQLEKITARLKRKINGPYSSYDSMDGLDVFRDIWHPAGLSDFIKKTNPEYILLFTSGTDDVVSKVIKENKKTIIFVCGEKLNTNNCFEDIDKMKSVKVICDSKFIQKRIKDEIGVESIIVGPFIKKENYATKKRGRKILMINPIPEKGGNIVLEIAKKMKEREFLLVGKWQHVAMNKEVIKLEREFLKLDNVIRKPNSTDMKKLFEDCYCLLMPSVVNEAYGRIVAEAQISGIPVIASKQGALIETVGKGGLTIDINEPIEKWVDALDLIYSDSNLYEELSKNAISESLKLERKEDYIEEKVLSIIAEL